MNREEIIKVLTESKNTLGDDEDIAEFIDLYGNRNFQNDIQLRLQYGSYYMKKYGKQVIVEWD